jgi:hypothetical protein
MIDLEMARGMELHSATKENLGARSWLQAEYNAASGGRCDRWSISPQQRMLWGGPADCAFIRVHL